MKLYMAGGVHGNLNPAWRRMARGKIDDAGFYEALRKEGFLTEQMQIFLAGVDRDNHRQVKEALSEDDMKIFLAGVAPWRNEGLYDRTIIGYRPYILESFYYTDADTERLLPYFGDFLLDSGAFTFMGGFDFVNTGKGVNFIEYTERYADFINRNKVEKFFELDVDVCVGYEKVKEYRRLLERLTNKQPIPVWHSTRGRDDFIRCCDEYPYVALGGIVGGEWSAKAERYIPWFIREAHRRKAKIHGLGFTKLKKLKDYHFDSVDSTSWTTGNRFGYLYFFDGQTMQQRAAPAGYRIKEPRKAALHNYIEWLKFQKWADTHL